MSATQTTPAAADKGNAGKSDPTQQVIDVVTKMAAQVEAQAKDLEEIKKKAATPAYPGGWSPAHLFHATSGPLGERSESFSIMRAAAFATGVMEAEHCKAEIDAHNRLKALYGGRGFQSTVLSHHRPSFLVPFDTNAIPPYDNGDKLAAELRQKQAASVRGFDPDEAHWLNNRMRGLYTKALGAVTDTQGGSLVGFPTLGEMIDLQRNLEAFASAGASEVALPPNGLLTLPKLTGGSVAYWVGQSAAVTESTPSTGSLSLQAKKLGLFVKLNNEAVRFVNPSMEGLVRMDMARQGALKLDLAMLEGTGGTEIKGLITYESAASWSQGTDKLIAYSVTGNKFQPKDAANMEGLLPDAIEAPTAWLMRKNMWSVIMNRRADAVTTADGAGPFVFNLIRGAGDKPPLELYGTKVVRTSQVSNTRNTGARTYVILGYFPDWVIARFGVMEFLASNVGDTPLQNDQTWIRGIQHVDAGPRHAASFVFADEIDIS